MRKIRSRLQTQNTIAYALFFLLARSYIFVLIALAIIPKAFGIKAIAFIYFCFCNYPEGLQNNSYALIALASVS